MCSSFVHREMEDGIVPAIPCIAHVSTVKITGQNKALPVNLLLSRLSRKSAVDTNSEEGMVPARDALAICARHYRRGNGLPVRRF